MSDVIELPGICPLCDMPIEPGEPPVMNDDGQHVHGACWAELQDVEARNNPY